MKAWFENLEVRERRLIVTAAAMVAMMLVYILLWKPISGEYHRLDMSIKQKEKTLAEMERLAVEAKQLQRVSAQTTARSHGSLLAAVDRTAKSNGLGNAVKRVRPDGENKASVTLEGAQFDRVVVWLENLNRREGISVVSSTIEKQKEAGLVSMRIELKEASQ